MPATLSSRERVKRALERRPHDRIPRHETIWGQTIERWQTEGLEGGVEAVLEHLQSDFARLSPFFWPSPYPGREEIIEETETTKVIRDQWGTTLRYFKQRAGTPEALGCECDSPEVWETRFKPIIQNGGPVVDPAPWREALAAARQRDKWAHLIAVEPFEVLRAMIGDEETMIGIKEDPEWIRDMAVTTTDYTLRQLEAHYQAGIEGDGLWVYGDMAFNHSTMCSPDDYRNLIWPEHKRLCDWAHSKGMHFIFHTDGNVNGVVPLYLEAGFDALQPLESKAGMDIRQLVPQYGPQLSFFGNIDIMVLITNDLERIEAEVRSKIEAGKQHNGYLYHSDHSVPPQVSWETYQAVIRMVEQYGDY